MNMVYLTGVAVNLSQRLRVVYQSCIEYHMVKVIFCCAVVQMQLMMQCQLS